MIVIVNLDKFFVVALQEQGFDVDYKKLVEIYKSSRSHPECVARKKQNDREKQEIMQLMGHEMRRRKA